MDLIWDHSKGCNNQRVSCELLGFNYAHLLVEKLELNCLLWTILSTWGKFGNGLPGLNHGAFFRDVSSNEQNIHVRSWNMLQ